MVCNGKTLVKLDDLGVPLFSETSILLCLSSNFTRYEKKHCTRYGDGIFLAAFPSNETFCAPGYLPVDASGDFVYQVGNHLGNGGFKKDARHWAIHFFHWAFNITPVNQQQQQQRQHQQQQHQQQQQQQQHVHSLQFPRCPSAFQNSKELVMIEITLTGSTLVSDFSSSKDIWWQRDIPRWFGFLQCFCLKCYLSSSNQQLLNRYLDVDREYEFWAH